MQQRSPWMALPALLALATLACRSQSNETAAPAPQAARERARGPEPARPVEPVRAAEPLPAEPTAGVKLKAKVGEAAPPFTLKDLDGKEHALAGYRGKYVVLEWFSPGCPYCEYAYGDGALKTMPEQAMKDGIVWLSVNSEAPERKAAGAAANRKFVETYGLKSPILFDPTGAVGRSYGAKTTPHMFVIDPQGVLVYQGALDNAPLGKTADGTARVDYVGNALADARAGRKVATPEVKSYG